MRAHNGCRFVKSVRCPASTEGLNSGLEREIITVRIKINQIARLIVNLVGGKV